MSGRTLKDSALRTIEEFMPDYLGKRLPKSYTIERQADADRAFGAKLLEIQRQ
jgi:hypothetical protein